MDLSQYPLIWEYMQPELLLLAATVLLFFIDLFAPSRFLDKWFSAIACVLFIAVTAISCIPGTETHTLFGGMFVSTPMTTMVKMILNIGTLLILLQAHEWINSEACKIRRGEFYELLFFTLFGMLPFCLMPNPLSITDAFFESVSGLTTTGASILVNVEAMPHGILFWRSFIHT